MDDTQTPSTVHVIHRVTTPGVSATLRRGDDYYVVTDRWQKWTDLKVDAATMATLSQSCDEFLVHGVDGRGLSLAYNLPLS
jgi:chemotaxis regulatin CheY-phosphate phosphatase CheZ